MSVPLIRRAFENRLLAMAPALATALQNAKFEPVLGTPYQRLYLLPAEPATVDIGLATTDERGIFQVSLCYPQEKGPGAAEARAELIRQHFSVGTEMIESGLRIRVTRKPAIAAGIPDGAWWMVPVSIRYRCFT